MSMIINIGSAYGTLPTSPAPTGTITQRWAASHVSDGDRVEFSRFGRALARAAEESSLRLARSRAIYAEIANGTYETPERLNGTVERLLDVIG